MERKILTLLVILVMATMTGCMRPEPPKYIRDQQPQKNVAYAAIINDPELLSCVPVPQPVN